MSPLKGAADSDIGTGIIVRMVRCLDAEALLEAKRKKNTLSTPHLGMVMDIPVYINKSLSPGRLRLMSEAHKIKKDANYRYLWVGGGNIIMRKFDDDKVIVISTSSDLLGIK